MSNDNVPKEQMLRIVAAADLAYDAARWAVGDSFELSQILHQLAFDSFMAGMEYGSGFTPGPSTLAPGPSPGGSQEAGHAR